MLTAENIICR